MSLKYQFVYNTILDRIEKGVYRKDDKLPSEHQFADEFSCSRPTISRALNTLEKEGFLTRRAGAGTFLIKNVGHPPTDFLGLLVPDARNVEIFGPICSQIAASANEYNFNLIWGTGEIDPLDRGLAFIDEICYRLVNSHIKGLFFAALTEHPEAIEANRRVVKTFEQRNIPIVLIDRDIAPYPQRTPHDLVGIDNYRSSYLLAEHFIKLGAKRIDFLFKEYMTPFTITLRIYGYQEALRLYNIAPLESWIHKVDRITSETVEKILHEKKVKNLICINDHTAAEFMETALKMGFRIPDDFRIAGFDNQNYAKSLKVPLTTIHQPCREIGAAAVDLMVLRLKNPDMIKREILLDTHLIIRESTVGNTPLQKKQLEV